MAQNGNIVLYDGKATPVAHTFYPVSAKNNIFLYRERVAGVPLAGQASLRIDMSKVDPNKVSIATASLAIPILELVGSANAAGYTAAPKVAHTVRAEAKFYVHPRALEAEVKDARVMLQELHINSVIWQDCVQNQQAPI